MKKNTILNPVLHSMARGYQKQLVKYQAMLKLAERQKESVEKDELEKIEEIIIARQFLIRQLDEMNKKMKPLQKEIMKILALKEFSTKALREKVPGVAAEELEQVFLEIGDVLYNIKSLDKINEELLKQRLKKVKTKVMQKNPFFYS